MYKTRRRTTGSKSSVISLYGAYYGGRSSCFSYELLQIRVYEEANGQSVSQTIRTKQYCQDDFKPFYVLFYEKYNCTGVGPDESIESCKPLKLYLFDVRFIPKSGQNDKEKACNILGDVRGTLIQRAVIDVSNCTKPDNKSSLMCDDVNPLKQNATLERNNGTELLDVLSDYPVMVEFFGNKLCIALKRFTQHRKDRRYGKICLTGERCCEEKCFDVPENYNTSMAYYVPYNVDVANNYFEQNALKLSLTVLPNPPPVQTTASTTTPSSSMINKFNVFYLITVTITSCL